MVKELEINDFDLGDLGGGKDTPTSDVDTEAEDKVRNKQLAYIIENRRTKKKKEVLGLSMNVDVCDALRKLKHDTGVDMSEAVERFVRFMIPEYFEK